MLSVLLTIFDRLLVPLKGITERKTGWLGGRFLRELYKGCNQQSSRKIGEGSFVNAEQAWRRAEIARQTNKAVNMQHDMILLHNLCAIVKQILGNKSHVM
ncbi:unnamed protein product [Fraxinus pennsylvanica]|uniref:Uncharacterized protein n=1 Tax=Fraxinus pennsylvanica TaxID=56036 RepID=A0AAD1YPW2_9LAMI|nr:unnamed protein product [Fraxinus pennsylvanica]